MIFMCGDASFLLCKKRIRKNNFYNACRNSGERGAGKRVNKRTVRKYKMDFSIFNNLSELKLGNMTIHKR